MRVRAVFLDLDGTLLDYPGDAWAQTVREVCAGLADMRPGLDAGQLCSAYTRTCTAFYTALEETAGDAPVRQIPGLVIWRDLWAGALSECGQPDEQIADRAVQDYLAGRARGYRLFADALPAIGVIRDRVGALALITNGAADTQQHKIDVTGLGNLADAIVISGAAGVAKPDPAIFALAAARLDVPLAAAIHVGDSLGSDVAGARNAGLHAAVWLNRTAAVRPAGLGSAEPQHEIVSLTELSSLLH